MEEVHIESREQKSEEDERRTIFLSSLVARNSNSVLDTEESDFERDFEHPDTASEKLVEESDRETMASDDEGTGEEEKSSLESLTSILNSRSPNKVVKGSPITTLLRNRKNLE